MTTTQTEIEAVEIEELFPFEDDFDPAARAHIVDNLTNAEVYGSGLSATDIVEMARLAGTEVVALCGYKWVPKRNPLNHSTCEKCMAIWKGMK